MEKLLLMAQNLLSYPKLNSCPVLVLELTTSANLLLMSAFLHPTSSPSSPSPSIKTPSPPPSNLASYKSWNNQGITAELIRTKLAAHMPALLPTSVNSPNAPIASIISGLHTNNLTPNPTTPHSPLQFQSNIAGRSASSNKLTSQSAVNTPFYAAPSRHDSWDNLVHLSKGFTQGGWNKCSTFAQAERQLKLRHPNYTYVGPGAPPCILPLFDTLYSHQTHVGKHGKLPPLQCKFIKWWASFVKMKMDVLFLE